MLSRKSSMEFGIIGLGRFGFNLAKSLAESGKNVMVIDENESKIKQIRGLIDEAFVVSNLDRESLAETGIQNCDTVVVCIGEKIDTCILTTLNVINMGVPRVIAKAISNEQGLVLEKIGAEVVYPERDMALRLANTLVYSEALDFIKLDGGIIISELMVTEKINGVAVSKLNLPKNFNINIIALERDFKTIIDVSSDTVLTEEDAIVCIGKAEDIKKFEEYITE